MSRHTVRPGTLGLTLFRRYPDTHSKCAFREIAGISRFCDRTDLECSPMPLRYRWVVCRLSSWRVKLKSLCIPPNLSSLPTLGLGWQPAINSEKASLSSSQWQTVMNTQNKRGDICALRLYHSQCTLLAYADHKAHIDLFVDGTAHNTSDGEGALVDHVADHICLLLHDAPSVTSSLIEDGALCSWLFEPE